MSDRLMKVLDRLARPKPKRSRKLLRCKRRRVVRKPSWHASEKSHGPETAIKDMDLQQCAAVVYGIGLVLRALAHDLEEQDRTDVFWLGTRLKNTGTRLYEVARPDHNASRGRQA